MTDKFSLESKDFALTAQHLAGGVRLYYDGCWYHHGTISLRYLSLK